MSTIRILYHMARADFLERSRRYSFLIILGLVVYLGYAVNTGLINLQLGEYRGVFNSAWVGSLMALVVNFFLGWFGFYVVKNSVARDYETGVGQIMATTPLSRPLYTFGKWLSNFAALAVMVGIMALAGLVLQLIQREDPTIDVGALLAPFVLIALPTMALTAALAVLFETVSWLRGGFGNIVYFFLFALSIPAIELNVGNAVPALEPVGVSLLSREMGGAVRAIYPTYDDSFTLGATDQAITHTFTWLGVHWTPEIIFWRTVIVLVAATLVLLAALFFDRFDSAGSKRQGNKGAKKPDRNGTAAALPLSATAPLHVSLSPVKPGFRFHHVLWAELNLALKGQPWWWYVGAVIFILIGLGNEAETVRQYVLPFTWLWPTLIWSGQGAREARHNMSQVVFSAASPLTRQLPATWLVGVIIAAVTGSGALVTLLRSGDSLGVAAWLVAVVFIPTFALACGIWSGSNKLFEVLYVVMWYIGPLNRVPALDYSGATGASQPFVFLTAAIVLAVAAILGRSRQLQV